MEGRPSWNYIKVLIESDWNLKTYDTDSYDQKDYCINRIRLEFKGFCNDTNMVCFTVLIESDWNLKMRRTVHSLAEKAVLIESDWNLKYNNKLPLFKNFVGINRIRLEFKV